MKKIFFTPGPTELYPGVSKHFQFGLKNHIASLSHRSGKFCEIFKEVTTDLKKLFAIPDNYSIFFVGSGTEAIERTIQNCVEKTSFHFINGAFSQRFFKTAQELGKDPQSIEVSHGEGFDFSKIIIPNSAEMVCFTHNESSTGVMIPGEEIKKVAQKYPDKLIALDVVSSVPYGNLDYSLLDVVFFSVQKGFGLPAGLGVMIVSPRAIKKAESLVAKGISVGSYHGFPMLVDFSKKFQNPETPPVLEMYVLGKVIIEMQAIGIEKIEKETEQKAKLLYDFLDASDTFSAFVKDIFFRSPTIIVVDIQRAKKDIKKMLAEKGMIVGSGYGEHKDKHIRIANFPTHSIRDIKRMIKVLQSV